MKTDITILCDNYVGRPGFIGEHGFSTLIESGEKRYLFDAGSGVGLFNNLKLLDKNLKGVSRIFLSHGHYDHTGGLKAVLQETGPVKVVAHPDVFSGHYVKNPLLFANEPRYIGSPCFKRRIVRSGSGVYLGGSDPASGRRDLVCYRSSL